jgi:phage terminase large subunit
LVSFNPKLDGDDAYKRFVISPPPNAVVVKTSCRDNPALSDELRVEIEHLKATDPDEYERVYEGMCRQSVTGAVYRNELLAADKEGRICRVPFDASQPVETFWDLGYFDTFATWLVQSIGFEFRFIDFFRGSQQSLQYYLRELQFAPTFTVLTAFRGRSYAVSTDRAEHSRPNDRRRSPGAGDASAQCRAGHPGGSDDFR